MASSKELTQADSARPATGIHRLYLVFRQRLVYLRLAPFDTSTEQGRFRERYRRATLTTASSGISKGIALLATLISVPLTVVYLGMERFGLWMAISSALSVVAGFADLGLGCGLQNAVSAANGRGDPRGTRQAVCSAFYLMLGASLALLGLFTLLYASIPWPRLFNVRSALAAQEAGPAAAAIVCCYALSIPLTVAARVQIGLQEGYLSNVWDGAGSLIALAGILAAVHFKAGLLPLVLASAGGPLVATLANWLCAFVWLHPAFRPRWRDADWLAGLSLMRQGLFFFCIQIATYALWAAPVFVTAHCLGAGAAGVFSMVYKILAIPAMICTMFWMPLWPAYGDAHTRGDYAWIRDTLRRTRKSALLMLGPSLMALACLTPLLVRLWTKDRIDPSYPLAFAVAFMLFATSVRNLHSISLAGCGRLKVLAMVVPLGAVLAFLPSVLPFAHLSVPAVPLWVAGCELLILFFLMHDTLRILQPAGRGPVMPAGATSPRNAAATDQAASFRATSGWGSPDDARPLLIPAVEEAPSPHPLASPVRVLHVGYGARGGGVGRLISDLAPEMQKAGLQCRVLFHGILEAHPAHMARLEQAGVPVESLVKRPGFDWPILKRISGILAEFRPDVVIWHGVNGGAYRALFSFGPARRARWILVDHSGGHASRGLKARLTFVLCALFASRLVFVSEDSFRSARSAFGTLVNWGLATVIPNGVPVQDYAAKPREERRLPVITMIATLSHLKDHDTLLQAFRLLRERQAAVLWLVGDGPWFDQLRALAARLGIEESVVFWGFKEREEILDLLTSTSIYCFSTPNEACPISVLEAMAAGLPIVATDVEGIRALADGGRAMQLVPLGDVEQFAGAMLAVLNDAGLRASLGRSARARAEKYHSVEGCARAYCELVRCLLTRRVRDGKRDSESLKAAGD